MSRRRTKRVLTAAVVLRTALVLAGAAALLWFSAALTLSLVLAKANPDVAIAWWSLEADARASAAAAILTQGQTPADIARAADLAEGALRREPVNAVAARTLGMVAAFRGDTARAGRLMTYAESLSRRDVPTQLWMIESSVTRNDIPGALLHYDRALRTSPRMGDTLLPILVQASAAPGVTPHVAELVGRRPLWWSVFAQRLIMESQSPAPMRLILARIGLDPATQGERELLNLAISRLADLGDYPGAYALYAQAKGEAGRRVEPLRDGEFQQDLRLALFDWVLVDDPGLGAIRQPRAGEAEDQALFLVSDQGRSGEVARQMLLLPPGRYRLTMRIGDIQGDELTRPSLTLRCAGASPQILSASRLPVTPTAGRSIEQDFTVPAAGCAAQWIAFGINSGLEEQRGRPWLDSLAVRHLG